jgi:F-type H+-transporting ATPase subunit delta
MLAEQVAGRYATALFQLAREAGLLDHAWEQLNALADYLKKDKTFINFMAAPQITDEKKLDLIKKVFESRLDKPFYNFLLVLTDKHRINYLPNIIEEFDRLVRIERGIVKAVCITTFPLSEAEREKLLIKLAQKTSLKIELEEKIDKSIIGGIVVMLHNKIIDGSIKYNLSLLRNRLMKTKVH